MLLDVNLVYLLTFQNVLVAILDTMLLQLMVKVDVQNVSTIVINAQPKKSVPDVLLDTLSLLMDHHVKSSAATHAPPVITTIQISV